MARRPRTSRGGSARFAGAKARSGFTRRFGLLFRRWPITWLAAIVITLASVPVASSADRAVVLEIDGVIGPAVASYVVREVKTATSDTRLIVLRMNTPGGLDTSMREIISAMLASPVPVATYVAPNGARAASAGTYIAYASAVAAMAPGTNIGAATPVRIQGPSLFPGGSQDDRQKAKVNEEDAQTRKVVNDAIAYIRGLAALSGRNADWAADAVRNAASIPASEALSLGVIDVIADDVPDLLRKIDGRTVTVAGKPQQLATAGLQAIVLTPDWRTELLAIITNPNIAFILLLIGVYGLIFEFLSPGAVAPGVIGAIALLVGLYALNLLPINYAGALLVLIGIGLMVAEAHIGAFGAIGVGGIVAFVVGAIMMFPRNVPELALSPWLIGTVAASSACLFLLVLAALLRSRKRAIVTGAEGLIGAKGEILSWDELEGRVLVHGEIWRARAMDRLEPGARIRVMAREGLALRVEPA
jgi:membrane-bound serine protease (ClpP class)